MLKDTFPQQRFMEDSIDIKGYVVRSYKNSRGKIEREVEPIKDESTLQKIREFYYDNFDI